MMMLRRKKQSVPVLGATLYIHMYILAWFWLLQYPPIA